MHNDLSFYIKKTNKHLYLYLLNGSTQVIAVSTDSRFLKKRLNKVSSHQLPELIANIFAHKLITCGIHEVYLHQTNIFHGKIATIIQTIRQCGIFVK